MWSDAAAEQRVRSANGEGREVSTWVWPHGRVRGGGSAARAFARDHRGVVGEVLTVVQS